MKILIKEEVTTNKCERVNPTNIDINKLKEAYEWVKDPTNRALGLAAPQIGINQQWFIMKNPSKKWFGVNDGDYILVVINPKITDRVGQKSDKSESCFSAPGESYVVKRYPSINTRFQTISTSNILNGVTEMRSMISKFTGESAQIFQHEFDHLNGKCIYHHGRKL